jgi:hypothetical protein
MINSTSLNEVYETLLKQYYARLYPTLRTSVFFGSPVQKRFRVSNANRHSGPPNTSRLSTPPWRTSWQALLTLYSQKFSASRITKQSMPLESFFRQTRGQSTLTWTEAHWDTYDSSSRMHHMSLLLQKRPLDQHFGQPYRPQGGPQPTQMEQRPKSAPLATFGRRTFTLTGCAPPCNRR